MHDTTLVLLIHGEPPAKILLGYKKSGFGKGKFAGFGGKVEIGESILESALRELAEETGINLQPQVLKPVAILEFIFPHKPEWNQRVHAFITDLRVYSYHESAEMIPSWFSVDSIPYDQMWDDARYWLPCILRGKIFKAKFIFESDNETIKVARFMDFR
jgi:8-oxo-dGTP diphosphatase